MKRCWMPRSLQAAAKSRDLRLRTVVGQKAFEAHAQRHVVRCGVAQQLHGLRCLLIGLHLCEGDARVVVDGHEQGFSSSADHAVGGRR